MKTFTYFQVGLPLSKEPPNKKSDLWRRGEYPLRRWLAFTLVECDKLVHHELRLCGPELLVVHAETLVEADKQFKATFGRNPGDYKEGVESEPVVVTIT